MAELMIDRRRLLKLGISSGVIASLPFGCVPLGRDDTAALLRFVSDSESPVEQTRTGILDDEAFDVLSGLSRYVNRVWELEADMTGYVDRLRADLGFKTRERPSYLTEYTSAVELFDLVSASVADEDQVWAALLFSEFDADGFASTKLGRARRFVFAELVAHQIPLSGAFRSFGLWNYRGHFGGSYLNADSYRRGAV